MRSLERSALVEAAEQLTRSLAQIATLPSTPALRREEIRLQTALIAPLMHTKGYAAPEAKDAVERARLLIEQAEALGEFPEDPLLLFSVLYGLLAANFVAFNGDAACKLATEILALAEKQGATAPLMIAHRIMGSSLLMTGDIAAIGFVVAWLSQSRARRPRAGAQGCARDRPRCDFDVRAIQHSDDAYFLQKLRNSNCANH